MTQSARVEAIEAELPAGALLPPLLSDLQIPAHLSLTPGEGSFDLRIEFKLASDEVVAVLLQAKSQSPAGVMRQNPPVALPSDAGQLVGEAVLKHLRQTAVHERALGTLASRLSLDPESVLALLVEAIGPENAGDKGDDALTHQDVQALTSAGVNLAEPAEGTPDPALTTVARYARFISDSLSVRDAAELLDVTESRVRQRLAERTLHGVRSGGREWKLPRWQFLGNGSLPGLADVLEALPATLHPLAADSFLRTVNPDLHVDGADLSPLDWLATGGDPTVVAELVEGLPFAA